MKVNSFSILISMSLVLMAHGNRDDLQLTFEIENKEEFCLYQKFNQTIDYLVEYGVVKGGNFDIDFTLESPSKKVLYTGQRVNKREALKFTSTQMGDFKFCFSNNFSPLSHKVVFFSLRPFDERYRNSLQGEAGKNLPLVLTASEFWLNSLHAKMENVSSIQRFYRIQELVDRNFADSLNSKVHALSIGSSVTIVVVSLGQVFFLKYLFNKRPSKSGFQECLIVNHPQIRSN